MTKLYGPRGEVMQARLEWDGWEDVAVTGGGLPYGWQRRVDPRRNSVAVACVEAKALAASELPFGLMVEDEWIEVDPAAESGAPLRQLMSLLQRPARGWDGKRLVREIIEAMDYDGNCLLWKQRDGMDAAGGSVAALRLLPWSSVQIQPSGLHGHIQGLTGDAAEIEEYWYTGGGQVAKIPPEDVVHLRRGTSTVDHRVGESAFAAVAAEVFADDEGSRWTASAMRNGLQIGVLVSPDDEEDSRPEEIKQIAAEFNSGAGGENRNTAMVMGRKMKVERMSTTPREFQFREVRTIPEERISAVDGVPAIVAGLGAGLQRSTFSNYEEARRAFYQSTVQPMLASIAAQLTEQLVPEFAEDEGLRIAFDPRDVAALNEDVNEFHARVRDDLSAGIIDDVLAADLLGYPVMLRSDDDEGSAPPDDQSADTADEERDGESDE